MATRFLAVAILLASMSGVRAAEQAAIPPAAPPASELAALVDRYNADRAMLCQYRDFVEV